MRYLTVILATTLSACTMVKQGAFIGANKHYAQQNYAEAIRAADSALFKYDAEYSSAQKAKLYWIKAQAYDALGEASNAEQVYKFIAAQYPSTQEGLSAQQHFAIDDNVEVVMSNEIRKPVGIASETSLSSMCRREAAVKALEYFGVTLTNVSSYTQEYSGSVMGDQKLVEEVNQWIEHGTNQSQGSIKIHTIYSISHELEATHLVRCKLKVSKTI
ncbi:hypothetical protein DS2_18930 [Catenovulum agarivorans DS-2]|uniref:Lipoprotein n=1 Tax=Catenovulum agarivorans DS-2 TaxID=1328313 RepID=W7QGR6_9ALTE|nr:tetratricopeptide repeat protein [Catenovulum agarivorans]EWH08122.1 hypothetical protein DS2_18930 [Catenovulum agarivorans DS-2]